MIAALARNASIKGRKRFAFWTTLFAFIALLVIVFVSEYSRMKSIQEMHPKYVVTMAQAWGRIFESAILPMLFCSTLIVILVSSEFPWRTMRQNVIDGLSKDEVFIEKLLFVPPLVVLFVGLYFLVAIPTTLGTVNGPATDPSITAPIWMALGGSVLAALAYCVAAVFFALAIRQPGGAVALWIGYGFVLERVIVGNLQQGTGLLAKASLYLPMNTFQHLTTLAEYDPTMAKAVIDRTPPGYVVPLLGHALIPAALLWMAVFLAGGLVMFRRRDL